MQYLKQYKTVLMIAAGLFIFYLFYRWMKSGSGYNPLPNDTGAGQLSATDLQKVRETALALKNDIYGMNANPFGRLSDAYDTLLISSDTFFTAVCNDYKSITGNSLKDDMNGEVYYLTDYDKAALIIERMNRLNIQ